MTSRNNKSIFGFATVFAALIAVGALSVRAEDGDLPDFGSAEEVELDDVGTDGLCGPEDPGCSRRLMHILSGWRIPAPTIEGGVRFGHGAADAAIRFGINVVETENNVGNAELIGFEAIYLPDAGGFRLRFTLAHTDVLFFCRENHDGEEWAPGAVYQPDSSSSFPIPGGGLLKDCIPGESWGIGGTVVDLQGDTDTGRIGVRWLELNAIYNFLKTGNTPDYLHRRLNAFLGLSLDTVWPGSVPGTDGTADTMVRMNFGITGMFRTSNNRFEFRGYAGYRPNIVDWTDFSIETRLEAMYNFLFSRDVMAQVGLTADYTFATVPWHTIGPWASDRDQHSAFVGALFRVVF